MFGIRLTASLCVLILASAWNPGFLSNGLWWVVVPAMILVAILDFTELGNAINR